MKEHPAQIGAIPAGRLFELARRFDARLHLLHVVQDPLTQPWAAEGFSAPLFEVVADWRKEAMERLAALVPAADATGSSK